MDPLREQYERLPYPPVSALALPRRGPGRALAYETGARLAFGEERSHRGMRILVAGCGTLEALVVALAHPRAREVVAVDFSEASIAISRRRLALARVRSVAMPWSGRLPAVSCVHADLLEWEGGSFDYILASNVLHHAADPAALLSRLAGWLAPGGLMRIVTYPRASRIWMRETGRWLRERGLSPGTPGLVARARELIASLPSDSPLRSCFESQPETGTEAGLTDAFLNARENPLSPLEWRDACARAGLSLAGEGQVQTSSSAFLEELLPETRALDAWTKLQILDELLELCANPVLWLRRSESSGTSAVPWSVAAPRAERCPEGIPVPARVRAELAAGLKRANTLLAPLNLGAAEALRALREKVGPRVDVSGRHLPGLSILDHDLGSPEV